MRDDAYQESDLFTDAEKAAVAWSYHLTKYTFAQNPDALANMKKHYDHAQLVEATLVSGYFNMWNRFTDAHDGDRDSADEDREEKTPCRLEGRESDVCAHEEIGSVRDVDDLHDAEYQG